MRNKQLLLCLLLMQNIKTLMSNRINTILVNRMPPPKSGFFNPSFCRAKKDPGYCSGREPAWYYDAHDNQCHFFLYTGCGGNENRFPTLASCQQKCVKCSPVSCSPGCVQSGAPAQCPRCVCKKEFSPGTQICLQDQRRGYCRALQHKWSFDKKTKKCIQFVYGGCGGNENNFKTKAECELVCESV